MTPTIDLRFFNGRLQWRHLDYRIEADTEQTKRQDWNYDTSGIVRKWAWSDWQDVPSVTEPLMVTRVAIPQSNAVDDELKTQITAAVKEIDDTLSAIHSWQRPNCVEVLVHCRRVLLKIKESQSNELTK